MHITHTPEQPQAAPPCYRFCCSKFCTFEDEPLTLPADLNNSILPMVGPAKFGPEFDYNVLELPMRLLTNILLSDAAVPFITTMIDGDVYMTGRRKPKWVKADWNEVTSEHKGILYYTRIARVGKGEVNDTARLRATEILQRLGSVITHFEFLPQEDDSNAATDHNCRPLTARSSKTFPRGGTKFISLNKDNYLDLKNLIRMAAKSPSDKALQRELLIKNFHLASVILHEIGHVIADVGSGARPSQPFYQNSTVAESGFDFERSIFGGIVTNMCISDVLVPGDSCWAGQRHVFKNFSEGAWAYNTPVMLEWPNGTMVNHYVDNGFPVSFLGQAVPPNRDLRWRVPITWIEKFFTKGFWGEVEGVETLKTPKIAAWVFKGDGKGGWGKACNRGDLSGRELGREHMRELYHAMLRIPEGNIPKDA